MKAIGEVKQELSRDKNKYVDSDEFKEKCRKAILALYYEPFTKCKPSLPNDTTKHERTRSGAA